MTLQNLETQLKTVCDAVYQYAAPATATRAVVWNTYGAVHLLGDDRNIVNIPKIQLDIFYQDPADPLVDDVVSILDSNALPFSVQDDGYDDAYSLMRCILQLEVY